MAAKIKNWIGTRFGRLVVESRVDQRSWLCKCDCGNTCKKRIGNLQKVWSKEQSCGCALETTETAALLQYYRYFENHSRVQRGIEVQLSPDEFACLSKQRCAYCQAEPTPRVLIRRKKGKKHITFSVNGLDRVNPAEGYTLSNVVPCCGPCNFMKHTATKKDFLAQVKKIYEVHFT